MTERVAPGEEQERQRARDQRAIVGGVLGRGVHGAADAEPSCEPIGNRELPPVALKGPLSHRVRIGPGGRPRLSAARAALDAAPAHTLRP